MSVINHQGDYRAQRIRRYPRVEDQLDAIWKILAHLAAAGVDLGPEGAMLDQIQEVKQRNPKP